MSKNNEQRYLDLVNLFKKAYSTLETKKNNTELWKSVKNDPNLYKEKMQELKLKTVQSKGSIMSFWGTALSSPPAKKKKDNTPSTTCSSQKSNEATLSQTKETEFIELSMFC